MISRTIGMAEALRDAMRIAMKEDPTVFLIGEDIGIQGGFGGGFTVTLGLSDEFGHDRVMDTPISEIAIVGAAVGAAMAFNAVNQFLPLCSHTAGDERSHLFGKVLALAGGAGGFCIFGASGVWTWASFGSTHLARPNAWPAGSPSTICPMSALPWPDARNARPQTRSNAPHASSTPAAPA